MQSVKTNADVGSGRIQTGGQVEATSNKKPASAGSLLGVKSICQFNLRSVLSAFREKRVVEMKKVFRNAYDTMPI
jgi:hypothetical protein